MTVKIGAAYSGSHQYFRDGRSGAYWEAMEQEPGSHAVHVQKAMLLPAATPRPALWLRIAKRVWQWL